MDKRFDLPHETLVQFVDQFDGRAVIGRTLGHRVVKDGSISYHVEPGFKNQAGKMVFGAQRSRLIQAAKLTLVGDDNV